MLVMPSKPVRKLKAKLEEDGSYSLSFTTPLRNAAQFERLIKKELTPCFGEHDSITNLNWETRNFTLKTNDLRAFQLKVMERLFIIKRDDASTP